MPLCPVCRQKLAVLVSERRGLERLRADVDDAIDGILAVADDPHVHEAAPVPPWAQNHAPQP